MPRSFSFDDVFAWYSASVTAKANNPSVAIGNVSVTKVTKSLSNLPVDALDVSVAVGAGTLELAHYNAAATATNKLTTGYLDAHGDFHDLGVTSNAANLVDGSHVLSVTVTVTVSLKTSITESGYGTTTDGSGTQISLANIITGVNGQTWDLDMAATDRYVKQTAYTSGTYYYLDTGVWKTDALVVDADSFATQKDVHDLYLKTASASAVRFFAVDGDAGSGSDAATTFSIDEFQFSFASPSTYSQTKQFKVYVYGGGNGTGQAASPDAFIDGFSVTLAEHV